MDIQEVAGTNNIQQPQCSTQKTWFSHRNFCLTLRPLVGARIPRRGSQHLTSVTGTKSNRSKFSSPGGFFCGFWGKFLLKDTLEILNEIRRYCSTHRIWGTKFSDRAMCCSMIRVKRARTRQLCRTVTQARHVCHRKFERKLMYESV